MIFCKKQSSCNGCIHVKVCKHKESFNQAIKQCEDLNKLFEEQNFNFVVECCSLERDSE